MATIGEGLPGNQFCQTFHPYFSGLRGQSFGGRKVVLLPFPYVCLHESLIFNPFWVDSGRSLLRHEKLDKLVREGGEEVRVEKRAKTPDKILLALRQVEICLVQGHKLQREDEEDTRQNLKHFAIRVEKKNSGFFLLWFRSHPSCGEYLVFWLSSHTFFSFLFSCRAFYPREKALKAAASTFFHPSSKTCLAHKRRIGLQSLCKKERRGK